MPAANIIPSFRSRCRSRPCPARGCSAAGRSSCSPPLKPSPCRTICRRRTSPSSTKPAPLKPERRGWLIRHGIQYHWFNRGYSSFDDFLAGLSSRKRKAIRKERAAAREGLTFRQLRGAEIGRAEWDAMWDFYQDTGSRKWGQPYLTRAFFDLVGERMGDRALLFLADRGGVPVAGALNFVGPDALYGRYWGCTEELPFLHFELCYYQAVEWAIDQGLASVQAGAQGEHKIARGYEPVITKSAHFLPNRGFRDGGRRIRRRRAGGDRQRDRVARRATCPTARRLPNRSRRSVRSRRPCRDTSPGW